MLKTFLNNKASMLKSSVICIHAHRRCLSYFSSAFNNLANQGPQNVPSQRINNLDLDVFVNQDHKQMDLLDKLIKLRKQKDCSAVPLLPNILAKQLVDFSGPQDAVNVLRSPLQYGIFIDQFTGCHLMDQLLHAGNTREAAQIAALLVERDLCNNELVAVLSLKSFYTFLKGYQPSPQAKVEAPEVEKVRVKFLRNFGENTNAKSEEKQLGEALIKLGSSASLERTLGQNVSLLGFVLSERYAEAEESVKQDSEILYKDVLEVCRKIVDALEAPSSPDFKNLLDEALKKCTKSDAFDELLDDRVKQCAASFEPQLMSEYAKSYQEWDARFQRAVEEQTKVQDTITRVENIQNTLETLKSMRQSLWFFENKEDIDIQIYKKKVYYPKRWFGKKKKPKAVDAFYVPPNVSRGY
ncbi:uncharacterized protein LOC115759611 [Drosophila novamexicana]|uniref:uncharacterized protein LOC115759611 n=1 Tax=Drosophila novamexicana TaxID=47314 RepID=UPI0011E5E62D|nr:uncharacterized protein LOC115759611 [Drosophila novamexicana]